MSSLDTILIVYYNQNIYLVNFFIENILYFFINIRFLIFIVLKIQWKYRNKLCNVKDRYAKKIRKGVKDRVKIGKKSYALLFISLLVCLGILFYLTILTPTQALDVQKMVRFDPETHQAKATSVTQPNAHYIPATDAEIAQRNQAFNQSHGNFNPNQNIAPVSNWEEFARAYMDNTVTKIVLMADIQSENITVDGVNTMTFGDNPPEVRQHSLEIDGGYVDLNGDKQRHSLILHGSKMLRTSATPTGFSETASDGSTQNRSIFHMHDVQIAQTSIENASKYGFIGAPGVDSTVGGENVEGAKSRHWYYRLGNMDTSVDDNTTAYTGIARVIVGYQAEVSLYGEVDFSVTGEVFYLGSLILEPGTLFKGVTEVSNYSVVWFVDKLNPAATAASGELTIGENSHVYLKNVTIGASYPAFYGNYNEATIQKGATVNIDMQGNAWRFDVHDSHVTVQEDATLNLISRGTGPVLAFGGGPGPFASGFSVNVTNNQFTVAPGGSFFAYGKTVVNTGAVEFYDGSTNNSLVLNQPKVFDIRNATGSGNYRAVNLYNTDGGTGYTSNSFEVINSDVNLWRNNAVSGMDVPITGDPSEEYVKVADFKVNSMNADSVSVSATRPYPVVTDADLMSSLGAFNPIVYKRISGGSTLPEVIWTPVTDADKTFKARVFLRQEPTGFDANGNTILQDIFASENGAKVYFEDTNGTVHGPVLTDDQGYATFIDDFQQAGQEISAYATRGENAHMWQGNERSYTVIDVTPPQPAVVSQGKVTTSTKQLQVENAEAAAKVTVAINGTTYDGGNIGSDGKWTYDLSGYLNPGDTVTIYLQDNAGAAPADLVPPPPATNDATGNINPTGSALQYRDATFPPATNYTVEDNLPNAPLVTKTVTSTGGTTTQIGDTLTYTLTVKNNKSTALDTVWKNVTLTDTIPNGLIFDEATAAITMNGNPASSSAYTYEESTRLLTVQGGDLASQEEVVVTFKVTVDRSVVGQIITNRVDAIGESPREANFIVGPENPSHPREQYGAFADVANPGGSVFGTLELVSAPSVIHFGTTTFKPTGTRINDPSYEGDDLVVQDTRAVQDVWTLHAKLETPLTNVNDSSIILPTAIRYVSNANELILTDSAQPIHSRQNADSDPYNISDTWLPEGDGFKLHVETGESLTVGDYEATIVWELIAGPPATP